MQVPLPGGRELSPGTFPSCRACVGVSVTQSPRTDNRVPPVLPSPPQKRVFAGRALPASGAAELAGVAAEGWLQNGFAGGRKNSSPHCPSGVWVVLFLVFFFPLYKKCFEAGINLPDLRAQQTWHGYFFGWIKMQRSALTRGSRRRRVLTVCDATRCFPVSKKPVKNPSRG